MSTIPPQDLDAERAVLGSVMLNPGLIYKADMEPDDFYNDKHRELFRTALAYMRDGKQVDPLIMADATGQLASDLLEMAENVASPANISYYAEIVRDKAMRRRIRQACYDTISQLEIAEIDKLTAGMVIAGASRKKSIQHVRDIAQETYYQIERRADRPDEISGISSGFYKLDEPTDGFQPGDLIIVAGRPSMGKSAFAGEIAFANRSHIVSIEMTSGGIVRRWMAKMTNIDLGKFKRGFLSRDEWAELQRATGNLGELNITFDETALKIGEIEQSISQAVAQGAEIAIVDYLQLIQGHGRNREQEIGGISKALKGLAKRLHIPIVAVAQLSRGVEQRENKRPLMSDLRDSGQIEQDADIIIFLYRESYYNKQANPNEAEVIVAKGREVGTGSFKLHWEPTKASFTERSF